MTPDEPVVGTDHPMLSLPEIVLYLGDRDEADRMLRDLRLRRYTGRPVRVALEVIDVWVQRRGG